MRFKIDENLPAEVGGLLRADGHDALSALEQDLGGASDETMAIACRRELRALITFDTHFANIREYPPAHFAGLIVLRLAVQEKDHVLEICRGLLPAFQTELLERRLWIVEEGQIRIRE